jgi:PST family polysaccharide transporter
MPLDPDSSSLTQRAGSAAGYRIAGNVGNILLGLALSVILARLLSPTEFGLFGIVWGITSVAEIIGACGMLQALVQQKVVSPEDEATGAILQLGGALILACGMALVGPTVERLFGMPGLGTLIQLQSAVLVINALGVVPDGRLQRRLAFQRLTTIDVLTRALGGVGSIILALRGMGALALVIGVLTTAVTRTSLIWAAAPGRLPLCFRVPSAKRLLGYGTGILFIRICNDLAYRLDLLIIGHRLGAEVVGLYQRAYHLVHIPLYQFTGTVKTVLFPAMASIQDDTNRFQRGYLGSIGLTSMMAFPALALLWATADFLVPLLYGPTWQDTAPILASLSFVGYLRVLNNPNALVTQARGRVRAEAICQSIFMIMMIAFVFVGTFFGVQGVIVGMGLASLFFLIMMTSLALSIADVSVINWLESLRTSFLSTLAMSLVMLGIKTAFMERIPAALHLPTLVLFGLTVYVIFLRQLLTSNERQILERFLPVFPARLRDVLTQCIRSPFVCFKQ